MAFQNPSDSSEILYGASGDVRDEVNSYVAATTGGHYMDEVELPGSLVVASLRKATRLINTFLEPVYADSFPFAAAANVPKFLDEAASDIATYYVFRSATAKIGNLPEQKRLDYYGVYVDEPGGFLVRISDGRTQIPELTSSSPERAKSVRTKGRAPIFDVDHTLEHEPDPKTIEDIERERD